MVMCCPWGLSMLITSTWGCGLEANMWLLLFQNDVIRMTVSPSKGSLLGSLVLGVGFNNELRRVWGILFFHVVLKQRGAGQRFGLSQI